MLGPMIELILLAALGTNLAAEPVQSSDRVCLGVPPFENGSDWQDDEIGFAAASELADRLFASGELTIVGPADIRPVLEELEVEWMDPFNEAIVSEVAERIGCPYVLTGRVAKFAVKSYSGGLRLVRGKIVRATATVAVYLINARTGEVLLSAEGNGSKTSAGGSVNRVRAEIRADVGVARDTLSPAIEDVFRSVLRRARGLPKPVFSLSGNVVGTGTDGDVYVDRGTNFSVEIGQRFLVFRVVQEIRGTEGELLDQIVEQVGEVEVVRVMSRSAVCTVVEGEATEGDTIRAGAPTP